MELDLLVEGLELVVVVLIDHWVQMSVLVPSVSIKNLIVAVPHVRKWLAPNVALQCRV
jgi:hypothetical protein